MKNNSPLPQNEIDEIYQALTALGGEARKTVLQRLQNGFAARQKYDTTLVTDIDLAVEEMVREFIVRRFPSHGILGEENGQSVNPQADFQWIIDPIDGTQSLVHGVPTYGSMIGIYYKAQNIAGLIDHPALDLTYSAALNRGSFCNGKALRIEDTPLSNGKPDKNEIITTCMRSSFELSGHEDRFEVLWKEHRYIRAYYDCFGLTRAIHGQTGAHIEMNTPIWDLAPCPVMVEEAGGVYRSFPSVTDSSGRELVSAIFGKPSVVEFVSALIFGSSMKSDASI